MVRPNCVSTSGQGQQKFGPLFENPKYATAEHACSSNFSRRSTQLHVELYNAVTQCCFTYLLTIIVWLPSESAYKLCLDNWHLTKGNQKLGSVDWTMLSTCPATVTPSSDRFIFSCMCHLAISSILYRDCIRLIHQTTTRRPDLLYWSHVDHGYIRMRSQLDHGIFASDANSTTVYSPT